ncbi:MAG: DUF2892 domain-containing protein [Bacteroidia bacterium]|nr:DUF2892 domain-containing protein [Bacteroidia bacterium]
MALHDTTLDFFHPANWKPILTATTTTMLPVALMPIRLFANVGTVDRIIRLVLGGGLIAAAFFTKLWWLAIIGGVVFLTGLLGRCGLYYLFGITTRRKES